MAKIDFSAQLRGNIEYWAADRTYRLGHYLINPYGKAVTALVAHISGNEYDASKWSSDTGSYGIVIYPNGSDDTAEVQEALDKCRDDGGGEVILELGTFGQAYRLNKLYISRNTTFRCVPGVTIKRKGGTYGISNIITGVNPLTNNNDPYSGHGNIKIIGGIWDGNILTESYVNSGFNLFYIAGARDVLIEGVEVRDMVTNHCVDLNGVQNVTIRKSKFLGYKDGTQPGDSNYPRNYCEAIQCSQNIDDSQAVWYPMLGTPSTDILVDDCTFGSSGTAGTGAYPAGFGTHTSTNDTLTNNIQIRNCVFEGQFFGAVVGYTYNNLKVTGNTFIGCTYGLRANNFTNGKTWDKTNSVWITNGPTRATTKGIIFSGNTLIDTVNTDVSILGTNADGNGFWGTCNDITITDNIMEATTATKRTGQNIRLLLCKNGTIRGNQCEQAATNILVDSCVNIATEGNRTNISTGYGIQYTKGSTLPAPVDNAKYTAGNRIAGNTVENAGSHGIGNNTNWNSLIVGNLVKDWGQVTPSGNGILTSGSDGSLISNNGVVGSATGLGAAISVATTGTSNVKVTYDNWISKPDGTLVSMGTGTNNVYGNLVY